MLSAGWYKRMVKNVRTGVLEKSDERGALVLDDRIDGMGKPFSNGLALIGTDNLGNRGNPGS